MSSLKYFFALTGARLYRMTLGGILVMGLVCFACLAPALALNEYPYPAEDTELTPLNNTPIKENPAWKKLEAHYSKMPFSWSKRYQEFKTIAHELDMFNEKIPQQLAHLSNVATQAHTGTVNLMLDMLIVGSSVSESYYLTLLLRQWHWKLDDPLRKNAATVATLTYFTELLEATQRALSNAQATNEIHTPILPYIADFTVLHDLLKDYNDKLRNDISQVRLPALSLFMQIEAHIDALEASFPKSWINYYTTPLPFSADAFFRLRADIISWYNYFVVDYPLNSWLPIFINALLISIFAGLHIYLKRTGKVDSQNPPSSLRHEITTTFYKFDIWRQLSLPLAVLVTVNNMVHNLPYFYEFIPFIFVQSMILTLALAHWARTVPSAPRVWEQALPICMGLLLIHGNASPPLVLLTMESTLFVVLLSLLARKNTQPCRLRVLWIAALTLGLLLTALGFGRLTTPLFMLLVVSTASFSILQQWRTHRALLSHSVERKLLMLTLGFSLSVMGINYILSCSGLSFLLGYWRENAIPIWGVPIYAGDALLLLLVLLGVLLTSQIARESLLSLARRRRVLDTSAVPVILTMINCGLWFFFTLFVLHFLQVDITSLAFIGGGLTVGVGIASKTILSNFFCGLVIIFSRVVRAGDLVELNGVRGRVLNVNMRATMVETSSNGILLVPNEDMLNSRLTNWTLNNSNVREEVPVSVVPESDIRSVLTAMEDAAIDQPGTLSHPPPKALFVGFGDNSMDFILQVWVTDVNDGKPVLSALRQNICRVFAERGVMLASPRLDISMHPQGLGTQEG